MKPSYYRWFEEAAKFAYEFSGSIPAIPLEWRVCIKKELYADFGYRYFRHYVHSRSSGISDARAEKIAFDCYVADYPWSQCMMNKVIRSRLWYRAAKKLRSTVFGVPGSAAIKGNRYDIVFFAELPVHLSTAGEVLATLNNKYGKKVLVVKKFTEAVDGYDCIHFSELEKAIRLRSSSLLAAVRSNIHRAISLWRGNHKELVKSSLFRDRMFIYANANRYLFDAVNGIFEKFHFDPQALLTLTGAGNFGNICGWVGKKHNIPVINIAHAPIPDLPGWVDDMLFDDFLVFGQSCIENIAAQPYCYLRAQQLPVGGRPLDDLFRKKETIMTWDARQFWARYGVGIDQKRIISYVSQWTKPHEVERKKKTLAMLHSLITKRKDLFLVIKLHPVDKEKIDYRYFNNVDNCRVFAHGDIDLTEFLYFSDVVVIQSSVAGLEALCLGKKLIVLDPENNFDYRRYSDFNTALKVQDEASLDSAIRQLLADTDDTLLSEGRKRYIKHHVAYFDGQTHKRIAAHVVNRMALSHRAKTYENRTIHNRV